MPDDLLILDLDETLVFSAESPLDRDADFRVASYYVYVRPRAKEFLWEMSRGFGLAVWTSAGQDYAAGIVRKLFDGCLAPLFVWTCERCTRRLNSETLEQYWVKDLRKVKRRGYALERVLMIDDSPEKLERHYGNHLRVNPYLGDAKDVELPRLIPYLRWLQAAPDFRKVEKRGWWNHPSISTAG